MHTNIIEESDRNQERGKDDDQIKEGDQDLQHDIQQKTYAKNSGIRIEDAIDHIRKNYWRCNSLHLIN